MTFKAAERVFETSITTGTGTYTLAGAQPAFQAVSVLGANNYAPFFVTDPLGTSWEVLIGRYITGPDRLERTSVMASSNAGAAVNWGAGTRYIRCGWPAWFSLPRVKTKSVAGSSNVDLTQEEMRCGILILTGVLTGNIEVRVDDTPWEWTVFNNTTGAFTITFKTSAGSGKVLTQTKRHRVQCDGTNVEYAIDIGVLPESVSLSGDISPSQITANQNDYNPSGLSTAAVLRLNTDASRNITGLQGGSDGRVVVIFNIGAQPIVFKNQDAASSAANRFLIPGGDLSLLADECLVLQYDGTTTRWRLVAGVPAASDTIAGKIEIAIQSEMETGTDLTRAVPVGRQHFHPGHPKMWGYVTYSAGVPTLQTNYNITSITDTGLGLLTVTIATDFSSANWAPWTSIEAAASAFFEPRITSKAAGSFVINYTNAGGSAADPDAGGFGGCGDL